MNARTPRPLRVLAFGRHADAGFGGIERHVHSLAVELAGEVDFVNLVEDRGLPPGDMEWPCPVVRAPALFTAAGTPICPTMPLIARGLHAQHAFDLAHVHLPDPMSHVAALALPRTVPVVITWHSDVIRQKRLFKLYRPLLAPFVARAAAVVAATPRHHESMPQLNALTRPEQREVVPYGFDLDALAAPHPDVADLRRQFGERAIFALGRHVYYKGFEYLIDAMRELPEARLILGGSGPLTPSLRRRAAEAGVEGRVHFAGRIPDGQLRAYYQACEIFCMPSVEPSEAFGIVQIEAMACAKPVVCCELGNGVTWVNQHGRTGLVVPPRNAAALAAALRTLLDDPALRGRLGGQAASRVRGEFSMAHMRAHAVRVYSKVLGTHAR